MCKLKFLLCLAPPRFVPNHQLHHVYETLTQKKLFVINMYIVHTVTTHSHFNINTYEYTNK